MFATVAPAAAQPTETGRTLNSLTVFDGSLFAGFGDYGANTGPIDVVRAALAGGSTTDEVTLQTEQTHVMRVIDGALWVPFVDLHSGGAGGEYAVRTAGSWSIVDTVDPLPVHVFDLTATPDGIFLFGAAATGGNGGTVWRSTDDGGTWSVDLFAAGSDTGRFYSVLPFPDGSLVTIFVDEPAAPRTFARAPGSGSAWVEITNAGGNADFAVQFTFDGTPIFLCKYGLVAPLHTRVAAADEAVRAAADAVLPTVAAHDVAVSPDGLHAYLLGGDASVWQGDQAGVWTKVYQLATGTQRSVAATADLLYFGNTDGTITTAPLP